MTPATVKILDAKGLSIKQGKWVLLIQSPVTKEAWYRPFHFKQDAIKVANEPTLKNQGLGSILGYYGVNYFQRYEG